MTEKKGIFTDYINAAVRAGPVHNDIIKLLACLGKDALHRLSQSGRIISVDCDDG